MTHQPPYSPVTTGPYQPVRVRYPNDPGSWEENLPRFYRDRDEFTKAEFLHRGFSLKCADPAKRVRFYLRVAEGHTSSSNPLRKKAFRTLCDHVFKLKMVRVNEQADWTWIAENKNLLDDILYFFRLGYGYLAFENIPRYGDDSGHPSETARKFLSSVIHATFRPADKCLPTIISRKARANLLARLPQFTEVIQGLNKWDTIIHSSLGMKPAVMRTLHDLALVTHVREGAFGCPGGHPPASFSEALRESSAPALAYIQLSAIRKARQTTY